MKVLVSNDDGYQAEGLEVLVTNLASAGHDVVVFAPDKNRSGSGMSITLRESLRVEEIKKNAYIVYGSPVDCINVALTSDLIEDIDMVVSGINNGANLGDDSLYSGTVAAALEARNLLLPSVAVSVTAHKPRYYDAAANKVCELLESIDIFASLDIDVLNLNIPDLPLAELKSFEWTKLSSRGLSLPAQEEYSSTGERLYRIGAVGEFKKINTYEFNSSLRYDYEAILDGCVSLTPFRAQFRQIELSEMILARLNKSIKK